MSKLDQIEASLRDYKYQRAQDMISSIKDAIYESISLGQTSPELYPCFTQMIAESNQLIESYKLTDKTVFSSINMSNPNMPSGDSRMRRELMKKEKKIKDLQDKFNMISSKKSKTTTPDGKPIPAKKPASKPEAGKPAAAPAVNQNDKPLTVDERDNLIKQISSLNEVQSQGIIDIVSEFAQKDDNN